MAVNIKVAPRFELDPATDSMGRAWAGWDPDASDEDNWNHNRGRHTFGARVDDEQFATLSFDGRVQVVARITGRQEETNPTGGPTAKWSLTGEVLPPGNPVREAFVGTAAPSTRNPIQYIPDPAPLTPGARPAFLLTNNPDRWDFDPDDLAAWIAATADGHEVEGRWSTGSTSHAISAGDRAFLLRQGTRGRGIVASGRFASEVFQTAHWDGSPRETNSADVFWDTVLDPADALPIATLHSEFPDGNWQPRGSGTRIDPTIAAELERLWQDHVEATRHNHPRAGAAIGSSHSDGQGRRLDAQLRRDIEDLAQARLTEHYERAEWVVEDLRYGNPYDARASKDDTVLYLEAKGTTTSGERVIVTRGEVNWAREHPGECVMGILSGIEVHPNGTINETSGTLRCFPWEPDDEQLDAISFDFYPD